MPTILARETIRRERTDRAVMKVTGYCASRSRWSRLRAHAARAVVVGGVLAGAWFAGTSAAIADGKSGDGLATVGITLHGEAPQPLRHETQLRLAPGPEGGTAQQQDATARDGAAEARQGTTAGGADQSSTGADRLEAPRQGGTAQSVEARSGNTADRVESAQQGGAAERVEAAQQGAADRVKTAQQGGTADRVEQGGAANRIKAGHAAQRIESTQHASATDRVQTAQADRVAQDGGTANRIEAAQQGSAANRIEAADPSGRVQAASPARRVEKAQQPKPVAAWPHAQRLDLPDVTLFADEPDPSEPEAGTPPLLEVPEPHLGPPSTPIAPHDLSLSPQVSTQGTQAAPTGPVARDRASRLAATGFSRHDHHTRDDQAPLPPAPVPNPPPTSAGGPSVGASGGVRTMAAILPSGPDLPDALPSTPAGRETVRPGRLVPFELPASPD
ncbi:hypothetical protein HUO13_35235 [Saccharopolyspora erythraea]|uniref:hypothetical protein n=1 Tax=Saccharopolyspora erythraea TaxID=1836 RepID=UPI001BA9BE9A|nr:hypothetical protein [Saccharopolyspora erythraea]QUH05339.1 hypothetical protein HUO13_35235 [Saccharopolyspora erythraea]